MLNSVSPPRPQASQLVYNNLPQVAGLSTRWGFACVVETAEHRMLFDTGGDGEALLANMHRLGLDPRRIEAVVLSHIHGDHTGGLREFLARNPRVNVYIPSCFPASFRAQIERAGARVETVAGPRQLLDGLHSTGEMDSGTEEQALIIDTARGLVIITGCAHPDIVDMTAAARDYLDKDIVLLIGGFHLRGKGQAELRTIIARLKELGVRKVAPSHRTGERAITLFREAGAKILLRVAWAL
jgi:7,8-dihydropterin-6-yl-methyl-4-(beta-D-ribofuranosyl)aminobenzene 5'-phosphate synthase